MSIPIICLYTAVLIAFAITGASIMNKLKDLDNDFYYNYFVTGYVISLIMYFVIIYSIIEPTFMNLNWVVIGLFFILYIVLIVVPVLIPMNKKYKKLEEAKALIYTYCSIGLLLLIIFTFSINKPKPTEQYSIEYNGIQPKLKSIYEENNTQEIFNQKCMAELKGKKYGDIDLETFYTYRERSNQIHEFIYFILKESTVNSSVKNLEISEKYIPHLCDIFYQKFTDDKNTSSVNP
jgi:hypothetical protein